MRPRVRRHLGSLLEVPSHSAPAAKAFLAAATEDLGAQVPPELTPHQLALLLLHIAAEVEHALMVTYLYAAYSLGGPKVPPEHHGKVTQWREIILGIAKEEMGHLMTVQNLLRCLGGPVSVDREDYPWDSEFYPFPFRLHRLDRRHLARYVYVESPEPDKWTGDRADAIRRLALTDDEGKPMGEPINRVGVLYERLTQLFKDPKALKDSDFRGSTFPYQANWDEWGRGYQGGARGASTGGCMPGTPDLLLKTVTSRSEALVALEAVKLQGEANPTPGTNEPSHFARFLRIFEAFPKSDEWVPSREVPVNPIVTTLLRVPDAAKSAPAPNSMKTTPITHPQTMLWVHLFNLRYQVLLTCLLRTFEYPNNVVPATQVSPRGLLLNSVFGEMYNLRALAQILVEMPLAEEKGDPRAGPPFQMPYTLMQPVDPEDRWHIHLDLLEASAKLAKQLQVRKASEKNAAFLRALRQADDQVKAIIESILRRPAVAGSGVKGTR